MPLKMTSFLWIQMAHKVAKTCLHTVSRLNELSMKELQNSSSEDVVRRATPTVRHASWTIGHVKNKWEQSSTSPSHKGQFTAAPGTRRWRMALVIRRRCTSSQSKIQIFNRSRCFHINRHRRTREVASEGACPRRRRYAASAENLEWRHLQASVISSIGLRLARRTCKDTNSDNA